jgi:hypothetical protein
MAASTSRRPFGPPVVPGGGKALIISQFEDHLGNVGSITSMMPMTNGDK